MKMLAILLFFVMGTVQATLKDDELLVYRTPEIIVVLTPVECPLEDLKNTSVAVLFTSGQEVYGCWTRDNNEIIVGWITKSSQIIIGRYSTSIFSKERLI